MKRFRAARLLARVALAIALAVAPVWAEAAPPAPDASLAANDDSWINSDRPSFSFGASIVDPGRAQIETGYALSGLTSFGGQSVSVPLTLRWGLSKNFEVRIDSQGLFWQGNTSGLAGAAPGFKWRLLDDDTAVTLYGGLSLPLGSPDFNGNRVLPAAVVIVEQELAPDISLGLNAGIAYPALAPCVGNELDYLFSALSVTKSWGDRLSLSVEMAAFKPLSADAGVFAGDVSLAYKLTRDVQLDVAYYRGLSAGSTLSWQATTGVSARF